MRHVDKLKEIYATDKSKKKITENLDLIKRINRNQLESHKILISRSNDKIKSRNGVLIDRLLDINRGNYVTIFLF